MLIRISEELADGRLWLGPAFDVPNEAEARRQVLSAYWECPRTLWRVPNRDDRENLTTLQLVGGCDASGRWLDGAVTTRTPSDLGAWCETCAEVYAPTGKSHRCMTLYQSKRAVARRKSR